MKISIIVKLSDFPLFPALNKKSFLIKISFDLVKKSISSWELELINGTVDLLELFGSLIGF